jgi:hypothetical protein
MGLSRLTRHEEAMLDGAQGTDSLKTVKLFGGIFLPRWWFGQRKDVVEAAVSGRTRCTRWG